MLVECRGISLGGPGSSDTDSLDLTVAAGEVCTIVGSSGSGKSRLCRLLSGNERPCRGVVTVAGGVTHVVPEAPLWPGRSTLSNVEYVLRLCGHAKPSGEDAIEALRLTEVPDRLIDAPTSALSHFQRFSVWLAIHRLRQVPVLVMDDPFLKLTDPETESLARLINETATARGCAVITSGSADVPAIMGARRYRIARGQLMPIDTPTLWIDDYAGITRLPSRDHMG